MGGKNKTQLVDNFGSVAEGSLRQSIFRHSPRCANFVISGAKFLRLTRRHRAESFPVGPIQPADPAPASSVSLGL